MTKVLEPEVIIVGKGFAGLTLSFLLQKSGVPHLVLGRKEKESRVALGETLPPSAMGLLQSIGLKELFESHALQKTHGYHSIWGSAQRIDRHFFSLRPHPHGLKLNRNKVLTALEESVIEQIYDYEGAFEAIDSDEGIEFKLHEKGATKVFKPRLLVDATGRKRTLLKQLGIESVDLDKLIAFSCHVEIKEPPPLIHGVLVESFAEGWGIASRLENARFALSLFVQPGSETAKSLRKFSNWAQTLSQTHLLKGFLVPKPIGEVVGAHANSSRATQLAGQNWLAVGDAAISFDPLSSHGISNALYGAREAHQSILDMLGSTTSRSSFSGYTERLSGIFQAYLTERNRLYAEEQRWAETAFWNR